MQPGIDLQVFFIGRACQESGHVNVKFAKNAKVILLLILDSYNPYSFLIDHGQLSMEFIEGLPNSREKDTILVVVDRLTKYGHFVAMSHSFAALTVA